MNLMKKCNFKKENIQFQKIINMNKDKIYLFKKIKIFLMIQKKNSKIKI